MSRKRELARRLSAVQGFDDPRAELEQYRTPPELAATLVHTADLQGDIEGTVLDLGCGTGMLALAGALCGPETVVGVELDRSALGTARENEHRMALSAPVSWVCADVTRLPLCSPSADSDTSVTVLANPPFGAQAGKEGADRPFLEAAAAIADVSYSVHNAGSQAFVESFAADLGGEVTHAFAAAFDLPRTFAFHTEGTKTIEVELFRTEWGGHDR